MFDWCLFTTVKDHDFIYRLFVHTFSPAVLVCVSVSVSRLWVWLTYSTISHYSALLVTGTDWCNLIEVSFIYFSFSFILFIYLWVQNLLYSFSTEKYTCGQCVDPFQSVSLCSLIQTVAPDSSFIVTAFTNRPLRWSGISHSVRLLNRPPTWENTSEDDHRQWHRNVYFALMKDDDTCWYFLGQKILHHPENAHKVYLLCVCVCIYNIFTHILTVFSTGYGECLLDEPVGRTYELPTLLPGQIYNANRQCELMFGPGSQICPYMVRRNSY